MEELYTSIALVEQNVIKKITRNRITLVIPRIQREPPNNDIDFEIKVLQQAKKYPKLKMFFPELYK
jgi:hypothetical protein